MEIPLQDSDSDSGDGFRINKDYAERYDKWRGNEELQKLKDKYGDKVVDELSSSSSSESEDEDAEALTPEVEKAWLKAFAAVKTKDPRIYNKESVFFLNETKEKVKKQSKKEKPMFLKDYERKVILERGGKLEDSEEEEDNEEYDISNRAGYYEEQEKIKKSFMAAEESDSDDSDLLTRREKTKEEEKKEDEDYIDWLKTHKSEDKEDEGKKVGLEMKCLKDYWNNPNLDEGEKFLRDFIVNKQYLEDEDNNQRIPTYDEIVNEEDISDDEECLEKQEDFERKYNFRFEEPDAEFIKSFPRTIKDTVRRKDSRRADKRKEVKDRKLEEKERKREEIKQMKNLKKKEILDKLNTLREVTGNEKLAFSEFDLEGDFDPAEHDKKMQEMFDQEYYCEEEDDVKPVFPEDEELDCENWDNWTGPEGGYQDEDYEEEEPWHCEDKGFIMDADYDPDAEPEPSTSTGKKKRKRSKFAEALEKKKPVFNPNVKTFEDYFDEYYKLDYEDMIGDLPCRFRYRNVVPNDFGISTEEVLKCNDKELNSWVSLKRMSQYRTEEEEFYDQQVYQRKARNIKKKMNVLRSLAEEPKEEKQETVVQAPAETETTNKKRKNKGKERLNGDGPSPKKSKVSLETEKSEDDGKRESDKADIFVDSGGILSEKPSQSSPDKKSEEGAAKKKRKNKKKKQQNKKPVMSDERLKAYGINPKKLKYMNLNRGPPTES